MRHYLHSTLTSSTNTVPKLSFGILPTNRGPLATTTRASDADHSKWGTGFYTKSLSPPRTPTKAPLALHGRALTRSSPSTDQELTDCAVPMAKPSATLGT
ncbi:hypothetical protein ACE6H2_023200 [Prunus campanulata]